MKSENFCGDGIANIENCKHEAIGCYACCPYFNDSLTSDKVAAKEVRLLGISGRREMIRLIKEEGFRPIPGGEFTGYLRKTENDRTIIMEPYDGTYIERSNVVAG